MTPLKSARPCFDRN